MIRIDFPPYQPAIRKENNKEQLFDAFRKRWVALTPEEWVRQNWLRYLTQVQQFPAPLIAVEKTIMLGELSKRFDIVVYNTRSQPFLIIECKAMDVALDAAVLDQVLRYNSRLQVPYLAISNGHYCFAFQQQEGQLTELAEFPSVASPGFAAP
ncbi:MAG: type I restriction enzyme HsdR N-terminal domain-containing protein [Ferruginibacter sp.]